MVTAKETLNDLFEQTFHAEKLSFDGSLGFSKHNTIIPFKFGDTTASVLVTGMPGMGTTKLIRTMAYTVMADATPKKLRIAVIDGKGNAKRAMNNGKNPFLYAPIPDSSKDTDYVDYSYKLVHQLVDECRHRFDLFKQNDVITVEGYNAKHAEKSLPIIWLVCTDFTYLTKLDSYNDFSSDLEYLAKMGRGAGVRMLLSTPFSDSDNVPQRVALNISNRVAFKVRNHRENLWAFGSRKIRADKLDPNQFISNLDPMYSEGSIINLNDKLVNQLNGELMAQFGDQHFVRTYDEIMREGR